jgi:hypothetical protein
MGQTEAFGRRKRQAGIQAPAGHQGFGNSGNHPGNGQTARPRNSRFPFGLWNWGLPDLGFLSGNPRCELAGSACSSASSPVETWYSACVCPWIWTGKSTKCPFGDELSATVSKASTLYLKKHPSFPEASDTLDIFANFSQTIRDSPVQPSDIEALLSGWSDSLAEQSANASMASLTLSYLQQLSPEFKESLLDLIKEIQGNNDLAFLNHSYLCERATSYLQMLK